MFIRQASLLFHIICYFVKKAHVCPQDTSGILPRTEKLRSSINGYTASNLGWQISRTATDQSALSPPTSLSFKSLVRSGGFAALNCFCWPAGQIAIVHAALPLPTSVCQQCDIVLQNAKLSILSPSMCVSEGFHALQYIISRHSRYLNL